MLSSKQAENEVEFRGPPAARAFDDKGIPTKVTFLCLGLVHFLHRIYLSFKLTAILVVQIII